MRASRLFVPTLRESPADAETASHRLMLRAGLVRQVAAGIYSWLPLGLRVLRKVEHIVREEMDAAGAQELLMPGVQPAELWQESERWDQYGPELLRIHDRHDRAFCLGPTHEEVITELVRREIRSYKQLPVNFYQIQTKFRDEVRPRFGVMRAREFLMKDAYSFHVDGASLADTYAEMQAAYARIFTRLGLDFRCVAADTGSIGGSTSHEFHVLAESGEDVIAFSTESDYAANVELAPTLRPDFERAPATAPLQRVATPGQHTIADLCRFLEVAPQQCAKTLLVAGRDTPVVALVLRGDHELNVIKAARHPLVASPLRFATPEEIRAAAGCDAGSIGPVGLTAPLLVDHAAGHLHDFVCGANESDQHYTGVNWGRDLPDPTTIDLRNIVAGDLSPDGRGSVHLARGIEVGHVFQLGTKYSRAMKASVLDENGSQVTLLMGCYGIGVSRVVAAAIEQNHDEHGILWPEAIAPFSVAIAPINMHRSPRVQAEAEQLHASLAGAGFEVLLYDRNERPGVMLNDLDLLGIPHRVVLGERGLERAVVEYRARRATVAEEIALSEIVPLLQARVQANDRRA